MGLFYTPLFSNKDLCQCGRLHHFQTTFSKVRLVHHGDSGHNGLPLCRGRVNYARCFFYARAGVYRPARCISIGNVHPLHVFSLASPSSPPSSLPPPPKIAAAAGSGGPPLSPVLYHSDRWRAYGRPTAITEQDL